MVQDNSGATVRFLDKEYDVKLLKQAIKKSNVVVIGAGTIIHENTFDKDTIPADWMAMTKVPVVVPHEGKMAFILPVNSPDDAVLAKGTKSGTTAPFKAILVTKYNLNQSRIKEMVDVKKPIYEPEPIVRRPFNPPKFVNTPPSPGGVSQYGKAHPNRK